jgi:hypothetical protein
MGFSRLGALVIIALSPPGDGGAPWVGSLNVVAAAAATEQVGCGGAVIVARCKTELRLAKRYWSEECRVLEAGLKLVLVSCPRRGVEKVRRAAVTLVRPCRPFYFLPHQVSNTKIGN